MIDDFLKRFYQKYLINDYYTVLYFSPDRQINLKHKHQQLNFFE